MKKRIILSVILIFIMVFQSSFAFAATSKSDYINGTYTHNSKFDDHIRLDGIDVSEWNGNIDWKKVKAAGVDFAIIRVGGRGYYPQGKMYSDSTYVNNIKNAKEAGLMVGVYYFSQAITEAEAVEEANHAISLLNGEKLNLPVFMDYEYAGGSEGRLTAAKLTKAQATAIADKWCKTIRNAGYQSGMYANLSFLNNSVDSENLTGKPMIWAAQYYNQCQFKGTYNIWQYTSDGSVKGSSARTDCNFWYIDKNPSSSYKSHLANAEITMSGGNTYLYEGTHIKPKVTVKLNGKKLKEGTDYMVGYINSNELGTAYAYVNGMGKYRGYNLIEYKITDQLPDKNIPSEIISSSKYTFDDYIRGVDFQTSVDTFKKNITVAEGYTYKLTDEKDTEEKTSGILGTGTRLHVYNSKNKEVGCQTIVIKGDCDGDGRCSVFDLVYARQVVAKMKVLSPVFEDALDVRTDGKVSVFDLVVMEQHVAKLKPIVN